MWRNANLKLGLQALKEITKSLVRHD